MARAPSALELKPRAMLIGALRKEMTTHDEEPTYENQLWHARKLATEQGLEALNNPHAMIGRTCGCGSCFCCAAAQVYREMKGQTK